jgi:hypothetical protein
MSTNFGDFSREDLKARCDNGDITSWELRFGTKCCVSWELASVFAGKKETPALRRYKIFAIQAKQPESTGSVDFLTNTAEENFAKTRISEKQQAIIERIMTKLSEPPLEASEEVIDAHKRGLISDWERKFWNQNKV